MDAISDQKKFVKTLAIVPKGMLSALAKFSTSEVEDLFVNELKHKEGSCMPMMKRGVQSIFQTNISESGIESNDNKRLQLEIPDFINCDPKLKCYLDICNVVDEYFKRYKQRAWSFGHQTLPRKHILFALPGCKRQISHTDFKPCEGNSSVVHPVIVVKLFLSGSRRSFFIIIALQPDTRILVEVGPNEMETVLLEEGDVFVGRGDCKHAGEQYKDFNVRLHMYMDSIPIKRCGRSHDTTYFANGAFRIVNEYASQMAETREVGRLMKRQKQEMVSEKCAKMRQAKKLKFNKN
jgi:hypothetical protein